MPNGKGRGRGGGMGFGFGGTPPPWPYVGQGRGGLPRCAYFFQQGLFGPWPGAPLPSADPQINPSQHFGPQGQMAGFSTREAETEFLKQQAKGIKDALEFIEERLKELGS